MCLKSGDICQVLAAELEVEIPERSYWAGPGGAPVRLKSSPCAGVIIGFWVHPHFQEIAWAQVITSSGAGWVSVEDVEPISGL